MNHKLDTKLRKWLQELASNWGWSIEQVALRIGDEEIRNRIQNYPEVRSTLVASPFHIQQFGNAARKCWVMAGRFDAIRFSRFIGGGRSAANAVQQLISDFPEADEEAIERLNSFIAMAVRLGFSKPSGAADRPGASQLASLVLTTLYPARFVDFRRERWRRFAKTFGYHQPSSGVTYGEWVAWAGKFAVEICETKTFREYWPKSEPMWVEPLWVIAGICWKGLSHQLPVADPFDPDLLSFPEGGEKRRLHMAHERNQTVISKAKALGLEHDPMLRCQVCGFSFIETYREQGRGFIEAHHKQPVAELRAGSRTSVDDIALVCANCHRMLHRGNRTLIINELSNIIKEQHLVKA